MVFKPSLLTSTVTDFTVIEIGVRNVVEILRG